jgi:hypothetical protein
MGNQNIYQQTLECYTAELENDLIRVTDDNRLENLEMGIAF